MSRYITVIACHTAVSDSTVPYTRFACRIGDLHADLMHTAEKSALRSIFKSGIIIVILYLLAVAAHVIAVYAELDIIRRNSVRYRCGCGGYYSVVPVIVDVYIGIFLAFVNRLYRHFQCRTHIPGRYPNSALCTGILAQRKHTVSVNSTNIPLNAPLIYIIRRFQKIRSCIRFRRQINRTACTCGIRENFLARTLIFNLYIGRCGVCEQTRLSRHARTRTVCRHNHFALAAERNHAVSVNPTVCVVGRILYIIRSLCVVVGGIRCNNAHLLGHAV